MRDAADKFTLDMLGGPPKRGRGRPRIENPLSDAERARRYRQRKAAAKKTSRFGISQKVLDIWKASGLKGFYVGPNGETWKGKGLTPRWLSEHIRNGINQQSFFVTL